VDLVDWAQHERQYSSPDGSAFYALDPQLEYYGIAWELFRCCLLRTLLSYNGKPTGEGGAEPRPDLAAALPSVSSDGLTWTFRLKHGLHYAPPYEDTEIVAGDVVRALERTLRPAPPLLEEATGIPTLGSYGFFYTPLVEGAEAFAAGEADTISGLETPDRHTLVVHLTAPAGDLGHRFSLPATAPIPPGAADGRDTGYGRFLIASGPYMLESYEPGTSLALVRNPSWNAESDNLRAAYADRIELALTADPMAAYADVVADEVDLVLDAGPPAALTARYAADSGLKERLVVVPQDELWFAAMNVAQPPFDDVHVRRAANLAVDKEALVERFGLAGARIATHVAPDSLEGNLLLDYDPFATRDHRGDLTAARAELAASRYDTNGDGRCDAPECSRLRAIDLVRPGAAPVGLSEQLHQDLGRLGLDLRLERATADELPSALAAPYAVVLTYGWGKDFPNGSGWFSRVLDVESPTDNPSQVGADPERLEKAGYPVRNVPAVDEEIAECVRLVGGAQTRCWAELDQLVTEQIVPWIPYASPNEIRIVSSRVASVSIDQYTTLPSLDRIALQPGS
jgi:peptide/nickel transport system substrate-binding protein